EGTPEENRALVQGANPHWGRYAVSTSDQTILFKIDHAFFPNWEGTEQKRPFTLTGDRLTWIAAASTGARAEVVSRRAKLETRPFRVVTRRVCARSAARPVCRRNAMAALLARRSGTTPSRHRPQRYQSFASLALLISARHRSISAL